MKKQTSFAQLFAAIALSGFAALAGAQTSRWATPQEPAARWMIDMERKWAEAACDHNGIEKTILADDFQGVAPDGSQYNKKQAVEDADNTKTSERACQMFEVKVHFFGDNLAVLYGSESAIHPAAGPHDGKEHTIKLIWVDTWLKRDGKWQIISAEDMPSEGK
jgi:hypothetical protein